MVLGTSGRFNRYIVECKGKKKKWAVANILDLIDTLWNVKSSTGSESRLAPIDLIDTLWNVKKELTKLYKLCPKGFNRYIVECKAERRRTCV